MGVNWAFSLNIQDSLVQYSLFSFLFLTFERDVVQTVAHNTGKYILSKLQCTLVGWKFNYISEWLWLQIFDNQMSNKRRTIFGTSYTKEELLDKNKW